MPLESSFVMSGLGTPLLEGSISAPTVREVGGPITQMVIRKDQDWQIDVNWEVHGTLITPPSSSSFPFSGEWIVRAFLESIGPGTEYELPLGGAGARISVATFTEPVPNPVPNERDYTTTISVAANTVEPGVYKMAVAVTHETSPGHPGPIAGFFEGGMLQIYEP